MRSLIYLAGAVSFATLTTARLPAHQKKEAQTSPQQGIFERLINLFHRESSPIEVRDETCVYDDTLEILMSYSSATPFCSSYLAIPLATTTIEFTPTSTTTEVVTTSTITNVVVSRYTPYVTITTTSFTTAAQNAKRVAQVTPAARIEKRFAGAAHFLDFLQKRADNSSLPTTNATFEAGLSSACSCLEITPAVGYTETYTDETAIVTLTAKQYVDATVTSTLTAGTLTTTLEDVLTLEGPPASTTSSSTTLASSSTVSSTSNPTPTSPAFTCPDNNNQTVNQMVDNMLYTFLILCNTDLTDSDLSSYVYPTFTQCVAACAVADSGMNDATCQGLVFYPSAVNSGSDCFLKKTAASQVPAMGIDTAILIGVAMGGTSDNTTTSSASFAAPASTTSMDTSSMMSSILANSTTSMPIITPGPSVSGRLPGDASTYTYYTSDGSTYSTASVYSTYVSANGSWYESYYTTYTEAWTSGATSVESAAASTQTAFSSSNSSSSSGSGSDDSGSGISGSSGQGSAGSSSSNTTTTTSSTSSSGSSGSNGYIQIMNSTTVITDETIQNITQTITTTYIYPNGTSYSSTTTTTTSESQTNNGGANGGSTTQAMNTTSIVITNTNMTTTSESTTGSGGGSSGTSGNTTVVFSTVMSSMVPVSTAVSSNGSTSGESGGGNSGGSLGTAISGAITPFANVSSPTFTGAPRGGTASPPMLTGSPTASLNSSSPTYTGAPRSGSASPPVVTGSPYLNGNSSSPLAASGTAPSSSPFVFSGTGYPRSGTAVPPTSIPLLNSMSGGYVPPSVYSTPFFNITMVAPTGSPPIATAPSGLPSGPGNITSPVTAPSYTGAPRSGTAGPGTAPLGTGTMPMFTGTSHASSTIPMLNSSSGIYPTLAPTSPFSFSNSGLPRSGTGSPTGVLGTGTGAPFPKPSSSMCTIMTVGTITITETTTVFGCGPSCPPVNYGGGAYGGYGGYGGPPQLPTATP